MSYMKCIFHPLYQEYLVLAKLFPSVPCLLAINLSEIQISFNPHVNAMTQNQIDQFTVYVNATMEIK